MWEIMIIKSLDGTEIIETNHKTMRAALEYCAEEGIDVAHVDLRKARLSHASLDGLMARGACLWGADFTGADIGFSDLRGADMRCSNLKDACFVESDLSGADLQGAYFSGTIVEAANLDHIIVSCPSFWDCDLQSATFKEMTYNHLGEREITLSSPPVVVGGLAKRLVVADSFYLWGNEAASSDTMPQDVKRALFTAKTMIERAMHGSVLRSAMKPIPKIETRKGGF